MLSDFYVYYICVILYVIQLFAAKYGNKYNFQFNST